MTTELDGYADALAELLDEKIPLEDAYDQIADSIYEDDIDMADVILHFAKVYEATTEEYVDNIADDDKWALDNDLVGVHFDKNDDVEVPIIDRDFDDRY